MSKTGKARTKLTLVILVIVLLVLTFTNVVSKTVADVQQQNVPCGDGKNATVCFDNVVLQSNGVPPYTVVVCPEPRSRVGIIVTCGGTLKIRAYDAPLFPEEVEATQTANAAPALTPLPTPTP